MPARRLSAIVAAAALALAAACASNRQAPHPTLEDYSDGVSVFAEEFLQDWKSHSPDPRFYASDLSWSGPLPGEQMARVPAREPLEIWEYRGETSEVATVLPSPQPSPGGRGGGSPSPSSVSPAGRGGARPRPRAAARAAPTTPETGGQLRSALAGIRSKFASLGRCENVIFEFRRRGTKREADFALLLTGRGTDGRLRQEAGRIRAILRPGSQPRSWVLESGRLLSWLSASAGEPLYEEVAARAGISHLHRAFLPNAARNLPIPGEHMPPGAAVLDFDGDDMEDLFVAGGDRNRLYRNRGGGSYEEVAEKAGVAGQDGEGIGALAFDYDNDGRTDLYVTYLDRPNLLYRNRGDGTFEEVGRKAGVDLSDYCTSAAALDYDRDGDADLYVLVYGPTDRGPNIAADNAPPNHLFRNNGDGTFTDVSKRSKTDDTRWALAVESADFDADGWPDLYIANDFGINTYLRNNGEGTFSNRAGKARVTDAGFGMGVAADDYDGDGRLDLYVSNYSFPLNWFLRDRRYPMPEFPYSLGRPLVWRRLKAMSRGSSLFRHREAGRFERTSDEAEVWDTSWSWGCVFVDGDLDGRADLFVVNGMVTGRNPREREIDFWNLMSAEFKKFEKGIPIADFGEDSLWGRPPKRFYRNLDGQRFAELAAVTGLESDANQRGLVVTDADGDGAPDLFATGFLQRSALWINRNPSRAKTLVATLQGDPAAAGPYRSTREALGAVVTVEAGGLRRAQVVAAGYSFLSSGSRSLFFGLGDHEKADRVTVRWPSGRTTELTNVPPGRLRVGEPAGH